MHTNPFILKKIGHQAGILLKSYFQGVWPIPARHDIQAFNMYLTENATGRDKSDANVVGCQDSWRGINRTYVEMRTDQREIKASFYLFDYSEILVPIAAHKPIFP